MKRKPTGLMLVLAFLSGLVISDSAQALSPTIPRVSWDAPSVEGYGTFTVGASVTSGFAKKWCIKRDGGLAEHVYVEFYESTNVQREGIPKTGDLDGVQICYRQAPFDTVSKPLTFAEFRLTTDYWENGSHTLEVQVTDSLGQLSGWQTIQVLVQRPRPVVSFAGYSQIDNSFKGAISYTIVQPTGNIFTNPVNQGLTFSITVDGTEKCSGDLPTTGTHVLSCEFSFGEISNSEHSAELSLGLYDGQVYRPASTLLFNAQILQRPIPSLLELNYRESGYFAFASIGLKSDLGAIQIKSATCALDSMREELATVETGRVSCQGLGDGLGTKAHTLRVKLELANGQIVSKAFTFNSKIKNRPFPKLTSIVSTPIGDWRQKLEIGFTSVTNESPISSAEWYLNAKRIVGASGVKDRKYYVLFDSKTAPNGRYTAKVKIVLEDGQTRTISLPISLDLLPPPPPAPTITWKSDIATNVWKSGSSVTISGKINGTGQISNSVSLRTWQARSGWSSWRMIPVTNDGRFSTSMLATGNSTIELSVPKAGRTPAATSKTSFKVYGVMSVSAQKRIPHGSRISYALAVQPKWSGNVYCTYKVERFNQFGVEVGEASYSYVSVKLSNGVGNYSPGIAEYKYNQLTLACGLNWTGLESSSKSVGSAKISVY
jgi:hypothetical protein